MASKQNIVVSLFGVIGLVVFGTVALVVLLFCGMSFYSKYFNVAPTDEQLIANFLAHRQAYAHLREMMMEEKRPIVVSWAGVATKDSFGPQMPPAGDFPRARYDAYLALLTEAGGRIADSFSDDGEEMCIIIWGKMRLRLSVCSMRRTPDPQDTLPESTAPRPWYAGQPNYYDELKYRHIEGNWYRKYN